MNNRKQPKGFTLIELLLVFAVIIGLVLTSYRRYQQYTLEKDITAVKQNIALLLDAANSYYSKLSTNDKTNPTFIYDLSSLFKNGKINDAKLWPDNLQKSNLVKTETLTSSTTAYQISASGGINIDTPPGERPRYTHNLIVTVTLNSAVVNKNNIDWYLNTLGASESGTDKDSGNQLLIWKQLPGYSIKGISSDLWMMEGGLRTFKKALEEQSGS